MQPRRRHMWPLSARTLSTTTTLTSSNSITSVGIDSFFKNGRKISIGDCALFKPPQNSSPPFIGIIRRLSSRKDNLKLGVTWLYRPAEVKLNKGTLLEAAPNEIFYSFHEAEIHAASILHPCKVAFLRKGVQLPAGVSSFVCRRVYDIKNQRLCWLDDKDYINERQEEVDKLLGKTRVEMHAAVPSGGRSPKPMNGPASTQLKPGSDGVQNSSTAFTTQVKGKKRERGDLGSEPNKRERYVKSEDEDSDYCRSESMLSKIAKITDKGRLVDGDGVEKLVQLMQPERAERKIDLASRITLADIITATDKNECLVYFVQKGLPVLDEWLQEVHKGKINDSLSPKGSDKSVEEFLFALLRALDKLPVNLHALQNCNIGKSVNHLRSHKNLEIQKKARGLVDMWKKRVETEMKINDAKSGSNQSVSWPSKPGFSEVSQGGNRRMDSSSEVPVKNSLAQLSTKTAPVKVGQGDVPAKSASVSPGSVKSATSLPDSVAVSSKDVKEEKSSSSSQSQNNSQSYSSDHMKTLPSVWKEDARSSTAGSRNVNKASSDTSRHRRSSNGILGAAVSGIQKEASLGKSISLNKSGTSDKVSHTGLTCERTVDTSMVDHGKNHRLIVKFSNRGRSPVRSANGGSPSDPSVAISGASSPGISEKHDQYDQKVKGMNDSCRPNISSDINTESWQSNDVKDGLAGSDEQEGSPAAIPNEDHGRVGDENGKHVDVLKTSCSSTGNGKGVLSSGTKPEKFGEASLSTITALIESCVKYSEANAGTSAGDDGMNLLASVAVGETPKSALVSPNGTPARDSLMPVESLPGNDSNSRLASEPNQSRGQSSNGADKDAETNSKDTSSFQKGKPRVDTPNMRRTLDPCLNSDREPDENNSASTSTTGKEEEGDAANHLCQKTDVVVSESNEDNMQDLGTKVIDGNKKAENAEEKLQENSSTVVPEVHSPTHERCTVNSGSASMKDEKEAAEESYTGLEKSNGNKKLVHEGAADDIIDPEDVNRPVVIEENGKNAMYPFSSGKPSNLNGGNDLTSELVSRTETKAVKEREETKNVGQACDVPPTCDERTSSGVCSTFDKKDRGSMGKSDGKNESDEHRSDGSVLHEDATIHVQEIGLKSSVSKGSTVDANETEDCVSKTEASSASVTAVPDKAAMLDFDLNEGFCLDDAIQDEPVSSVPPGNVSALHHSSPLPVPVPSMTSGLPASVTITSAAKGPFVPPENPLKSTGQLGWKGSAATSAFRPAEPRKVLEMPLSTPEIHPNIPSSKHDRAPLAFDLNVSDERASEDMVSQSSTQKTHSELKLLNYGDMGCGEMRGSTPTPAPAPAPVPAPVRSAVTLDLDLNRVGEDMDNGQSSTSTVGRVGVPLMQDRSISTGAFPNGEVNVLRNFDLNNGPAHDEMGSDPMQRSQHARSTYPPVPPLAGFRMNNSELGLSPWFTPGNSYPTVAFPSVLPDREHPYPIIASAGMQRISGPALGPDVYRPVLSSSPAMGFSPGNQFPYPGFPFSSNFPVPSTSFSGVSTTYMDSSTGGSLCFPAVPSQLVGPAGTISTNYPRPYVINLPDASTNSGTETSRKWGRQNLDLNAGPGGTDREGRDERFPSASRQLPVASSQAFPEDQMRLYHQAAGVVLKRKEPEGGWDSDRFSHKQPSWQ